MLAIPVAFLAGLLRSRLARSGVGRLVVELGDRAQVGQLRNALARALRDPSVEGRLPVDASGQVPRR